MSEPPVIDTSLPAAVLGDRYELRALIGRGGMGEVYEAVDRQLGRTVAVKVLRPELAEDRAFAVRFRREARTAARLSHPGIVAVHDIGEDDGRVFIVMEFVAGRHLGRVIRDEAPADPSRTARIGAEAAEALAHAHARGVVHRDISPGNVMIAVDGRTRILDFGIARASRGSSARSGADAHGTVPYVSPERLRGEPADQRTDVYALGAVVYELLTGAAPRRDAGPIVSPRSFRPDVPDALDRIVMRCLAFDPAARYLRTADLAAELRELAGTQSVSATGRASAVTLAPTERTAPLAPPTATRELPEGSEHEWRPATAPLQDRSRRRGRRRHLATAIVLGLMLLAALWIALPSLSALPGAVTPHLRGPKPLQAPSGLAASTGCDGFLSARAQLSWTPAGPEGAGYEIWRREPGVSRYRLIGRVDDWRTTTFSDTGLGVDITYRYVVRAADGLRMSAPSREVAAPTPLFCVV
jgi:tRNA A-37 threonylcarbamoyl transferase component Bud32